MQSNTRSSASRNCRRSGGIQNRKSVSGEQSGGQQNPFPITTRLTCRPRMQAGLSGHDRRQSGPGQRNPAACPRLPSELEASDGSPKPAFHRTWANVRGVAIGAQVAAGLWGDCKNVTPELSSSPAAWRSSRRPTTMRWPAGRKAFIKEAICVTWPRPPPSSHAMSTVDIGYAAKELRQGQ